MFVHGLSALRLTRMQLLGTRPMAERGRHVRLICTVVRCVRFGLVLCGDRTMQERGNGGPDSFESHTVLEIIISISKLTRLQIQLTCLEIGPARSAAK